MNNEIKRISPGGRVTVGDGMLMISGLDNLTAFLAASHLNAANADHIEQEPVITEDIDCEIIEPAKLPPPSPDAQ